MGGDQNSKGKDTEREEPRKNTGWWGRRKKSLTNDDPYYELNCVPLKRYFEVLTLGTYECNLIWKWGLCRWNQVKLRSSAWTLNTVWVVFLKEMENLETDVDTEEVQLCEDRDWGSCASSPGVPGTVRLWKTWGRILPKRLLTKQNSADILILEVVEKGPHTLLLRVWEWVFLYSEQDSLSWGFFYSWALGRFRRQKFSGW